MPKNHSPEPLAPGDLQVWFWNMGRPTKTDEGFLAAIQEAQPDVVALVETSSSNQKEWRTQGAGGGGLDGWDSQLEGYTIHRFPSGVACLVRGEILMTQLQSLPRGSRCARMELTVQGVAIHLSIADIYSRPELPRQAPLGTVLEGVPEKNALVVGDFNTPIDSRFFDPYRDRLLHAHEEVGDGWGETWPLRIPLLWIDHCWSTPDLSPVRMETGYRGFRDHAVLRCWLRPSS